jgi:hypothetical protein
MNGGDLELRLASQPCIQEHPSIDSIVAGQQRISCRDGAIAGWHYSG